MEEQKDPALWNVAVRRAAFRRHIYTYIVVNSFFWIIWLWTTGGEDDGLPWPFWPMLGWGIGLAFSYFNAYQGDKTMQAEKEYEKLLKEKETGRKI